MTPATPTRPRAAREWPLSAPESTSTDGVLRRARPGGRQRGLKNRCLLTTPHPNSGPRGNRRSSPPGVHSPSSRHRLASCIFLKKRHKVTGWKCWAQGWPEQVAAPPCVPLPPMPLPPPPVGALRAGVGAAGTLGQDMARTPGRPWRLPEPVLRVDELGLGPGSRGTT